MNTRFKAFLLRKTQATEAVEKEVITNPLERLRQNTTISPSGVTIVQCYCKTD